MNRPDTILKLAARWGVAALMSGGTLVLTAAACWGAASIIHVNTPQVTLVPSAQDYANDYVEATGGAGIQIRVKTNNPAGLILKLRSSGVGNTIRLGDLMVRTLTAAGTGGGALNSWTPVALTDLNLWSVAVGQNQFMTIGADTRVANLGWYGDNLSAGFTSYAHTLVFTVVSP